MIQIETHIAPPLRYKLISFYFKWFNMYEVSNMSADVLNAWLNDLIDEGIVLENVDGLIRGREKFFQRVQILHKLRNTVHVRNVQMEESGVNRYQTKASVIYQNILPDGSSEAFDVLFTFYLTRHENDNIKAESLQVKAMNIRAPESFDNFYPKNRCLAYIYQLLYLFHKPTFDANEWSLLFSNEFSIKYLRHHLYTEIGQLKEWHQSVKFYPDDNYVTPSGFDVKLLPSKEIALTFVLKQEKKAEPEQALRFEIILQNNPVELWAKLTTARITAL